MSIDYGEKEREFLESLAADTGRDLAAWMTAIGETQLTDRNAIIDWLRHQGFMFSKASWLERIFNNGGKPIYGERRIGKPSERPRAAARTRSGPSSPLPLHAPPAEPSTVSEPPQPLPSTPVSNGAKEVAPAAPPPAPQPVITQSPPPGGNSDIEATLAKAKAFRPLAAYVLSELRKTLPQSETEAYPNHVAILIDGIEVALVAVSAKEIRLVVEALGMPFEAGLTPAKLPQGLIGMRLAATHMVALTDARSVTAELIERVSATCLKTAVAKRAGKS